MISTLRKERSFIIAIVVLTLVACVRVASTHRVFSEVLDEPAHLAAGYQWFDGEYTIDASHPPLARVLGALPLRFGGFPPMRNPDLVGAGNDLLYHGNRYQKTLARTRCGNLFLLMVACVATAAWARRLASTGVAILTVALLTTLPPVLGHAGVLTTDVAVLAAIPLALLAFDRFLERPTATRGALLGLAVGIGLLAKFSFLVFFPICAIFALLARRPAHFAWRGTIVAMAIAVLTTWAGYRFDFRTVRACIGEGAPKVFELSAPESLRPLARITGDMPLPAPSFFFGLALLKLHDDGGHEAYLLGEKSDKGWWYYFPVVFFYKTPIPFLLLALWGTLVAFHVRDRRMMSVLLIAAGIMAMAMTSSINIGIRHILAIYAPLSMITAYGVTEIWRRSTDKFARATVVSLLVWLFAGVAAGHPDYLAWFNELAGPNPAHIAVDSNLDWGQDTLRLAHTVREMQIESLYVDILTNVRMGQHGLHPISFQAREKVTGWLAVSETQLALKRQHGEYEWLGTYRPVRRIGRSIRLYYIP